MPTTAGTEPPLSQRRQPREVPETFLVALSFSGVEREFVRTIAESVERRLGASRVFFDEWFEFYIAGHDADVKLQRIYGAGCELAVVCVSATYGSKAWTRAEHEAIRSRLMQARAEEDPRQRDRIFPIRVGDGNVDGIPFNAIAPDVRGRTAEQIAELIVDRLRFVMGSAGPVAADGGIAPVGTSPGSATDAVPTAPPTPAYLNAEVQALSKQLEAARQRQQNLRNAGIGTDEVDREILEWRRKLRDGGQLRAGDALGDGRYLLVKPVGRGGFAVVWQAWDCTEQRPVAIKVLHNHLASDPQRRERFFRGARVMMDLKHPAVVRVLDPKGEDESFCYFVMELVSGGNLREVVLGNRVAAPHRLALILQVGEGLAEAHRRQLVHRDIKPANILLDKHGNAKLTDFDLVGAHDTTGGTRTGALGTVVYAAPECLDKPQEATARADVFGLGMTAIFGLAGHDLSMDTLVDRAGALAQLDCTESVRKVLERAVEWKQERRFADAAEMVDALRDALDSSAQSAAADNGHSTTQPVVQTPSVLVAVNVMAGQQQTNDDKAAHSDSMGTQVAVEATRAEATTSASRKGGGSQAASLSKAPLELYGEGTPILLRPLEAPEKKPAGDACLVNLHSAGPDIGRRIPLLNPQYVVGRDSEASFLVGRSSVSRLHARLYTDGTGNWWVEDLSSTNGTFVNEIRIKSKQLEDSDQVRFGDAVYKFLSSSNIELAYYEAVHNMVVQDDLTGTHNNRYFREFLEREIEVCLRHSYPLTLVMFDVDHLKKVNEVHGHLGGDAVLKELAARIRTRIRREDLFARRGGDEFACVMPSTALPGGIVFADLLRTLAEERPCVLDGVSIPFRISLGVTTLHRETGVDVTGLIRRADENLFAAKRDGGNRVVPSLADLIQP